MHELLTCLYKFYCLSVMDVTRWLISYDWITGRRTSSRIWWRQIWRNSFRDTK